MRFGSARVLFNWSTGLPMAGYVMRTLPAAGFHRDLSVRAAVLSSEGVTLCLLSAEVLSVDRALTRRVRDEISRELGILPAAIMLAATHTHASVGGLTRFPVPGVAENLLGAYAPERVDHFVAAAVSAARQAEKAHQHNGNLVEQYRDDDLIHVVKVFEQSGNQRPGGAKDRGTDQGNSWMNPNCKKQVASQPGSSRRAENHLARLSQREKTAS